MLPQVEEVLTQFPEIEAAAVNAEKVPAAAGQLLAFTAPVLLLYVNGKEALRESRFVPIMQFHEKIQAIYQASAGES
ncbi:thioredoxin family protein [Sediminibacillus albus]|uniref:thioredoxin family protein n=1 Tax=Sediminibacillus albus TaxID=407036 RepID=UPI001FE0DEF4|nr:thioredoxin family protein [Sediminibacillus albus]